MRTLLAALTALMLFAMPVVGGDFEDTKKAAEQGDAQAQEKVADLENFFSLSNRAICGQALSGSNRLPAWEGAYDVFSEYVSEAKRRDLTPQRCAQIVGRTIQVAKEPNATPPKPPVFVMLDEDYLALKNANVRIGPGTNHASVARVTKGDAITALGKIKNQN
jgi:uncharacterized protein YgiM (DUF1202 family)